MPGTTKNINVEEKLAESGLNMNMFKDKTVVRSYNCDISLYDMIKGAIVNSNDYYKAYCKKIKEEIIKVGEYNKIAGLYGNKQFKLNDGEYIVVADYDNMVESRNVELKNRPVIKIGGKEYRPKFDECQDGYMLMASNHSNMGFILVPDNADLSGCLPDQYYFAANYNAKDTEDRENIDKDIENNQDKIYDSLQKNIDLDTLSNIQTRSQIKEYSIGMTAMVVFIGIYLGIVFMVSGAAILALKELSEAVDNKEKYEVLRKIGVDNKDISNSILTQCAMFFGLPLIIALIHSIFGIQVCYKIMSTFGSGGVIYSIIVTAIIIALIYGVYFIITYCCSKKIVE